MLLVSAEESREKLLYELYFCVCPKAEKEAILKACWKIRKYSLDVNQVQRKSVKIKSKGSI